MNLVEWLVYAAACQRWWGNAPVYYAEEFEAIRQVIAWGDCLSYDSYDA